MSNTIKHRLRAWTADIDWPLLLFLAGATYVKLYVKLAAFVCYTVWLLYRKASWKKPPPPVYFYLGMAVVGVVTAAAYGSFSTNGYLQGAAAGMLQWGAAATIFYLLYITVRRGSRASLIATAKAFFALNALCTFAQFGGLIIESHHPFPYWYYDKDLKYASQTGDHLMGVFMNNSLNNAAATLIGVLFFLSQGMRRWAILCVIVLLMCTSNVVMFGMLLVLLLIVIFCGQKKMRMNALMLIGMTVLIYPALSPQNFSYIRTVLARLTAPSKPFIAAENPAKDTLLADNEEDADSAGIIVKRPVKSLSLHVADTMYRRMPQELIALREWNARMPKPAWSYLVIEPDALRFAFRRWYGVSADETLLGHYGKPAKLFAIRQTISFLNKRAVNWIAGAGMGNFSSKLAIKMTGLRWQGNWPDARIYIARPFLEYHFYTLSYVFSRDIKEHSVVNMPGSTWLQLAGEYGLIGLGLCLVLYFGWFWRRCKVFRSGRWILLALTGLFWLDYWYEMMTLTVVAEFVLLLGIFALSPAADAGTQSSRHHPDARL